MTDMPTTVPHSQATNDRLEQIRRNTADGTEFWLARDLYPILGYDRWENFQEAIKRAMSACDAMKVKAQSHFRETTKMVSLGSGAQRPVQDFFLSRTACYLIAMNGDPTKVEIATAQAYFTVQTRRMEIADEEAADLQRLELRGKVAQSFNRVRNVAHQVGVRNSRQAVFHSKRHEGLYGMPLQQVKAQKGIADKEQLLDRVGSLELSMHDFQMQLAAHRIEADGIQGERQAIAVNLDVAKHVRQTVLDAGQVAPENLAAEPPIKEIAKRVKKRAKGARHISGEKA